MSFKIALASLTVLLATSTAIAQTPGPIAEKPAAPKMRCKSYTETGSLARVRKECHTEAEWRAIASEGRANAQQYQDAMNSSRTN